jgi:hypothetical protein
MASIMQTALELIPDVVWITTLVSVLVLAPLGFFIRTRGMAGVGLIVASWVLGAILWGYGALFTFTLWGWPALIIGLLFVGIGVVPMAFLALAINSGWAWIGNLSALLVAVIGFRLLGLWYISKVDAAHQTSAGK